MSGFMSGFLQGVANTPSSGGGLLSGIMGNKPQMTPYQQARIDLQQQSTDAQVASAQSTQNLNEARLVEQNAKNEQLQKMQQFQNDLIQAGAIGGFSAAVQYAQKTGHFEEANNMLKSQQDLNQSVAKGMKLEAQADDAQTTAYNNRLKAVGGLGAVFFKEVQAGANPEQTYQKYYPTLKEVWPDAPKEYTQEAQDKLQIAVGQQLIQNVNNQRQSNAELIMKAYQSARAAGDKEAEAFYQGQLQKLSIYTNPATGETINLMGSVPDTFMGSVDAKANTVGLGAGSQIPPIPGAVFQGQPMNSVVANQYAQYDKDNKISPQERVVKNMKAQTGYDQVFKPDGTHELRPVVGGPADKVTNATEAARINNIQVGQLNYNKFHDILFDKDGNIKPGTQGILGAVNQAALAEATVGTWQGAVINSTIGNQAQLLRTYGNTMIEGILRANSGATINKEELPRLQDMLLPKPGDSEETIKAKMMITHEILNGTLNILQFGLRGGLVKNKGGYGVPDYNMIQKAIDYGSHGGDILDITQGNGADPEKARQNQLKELSYNPQQVELLMSGKINGQGRDLTKQEVKQMIDKANQMRAMGKKVVLPGDPQPQQGGK